MSPEALHTLERAHGLVAWSATVGLIAAAALAVRRGRARAASRVAALAAILLTAAAALGLWIHPAYDAHLRQRLFIRSAQLGWMFERKHHLAVVAVLLTWSALFSLFAASPLRASDPARSELARATTVGLVASAALALTASVLGALVARVAHF